VKEEKDLPMEDVEYSKKIKDLESYYEERVKYSFLD